MRTINLEQDELKLFYLACPYRARKSSGGLDQSIMKRRSKQASETGIRLLQSGIYVFSPLSHLEATESAKNFNLPVSWAFWAKVDKAFLKRCDGGLILLKLESWDRSVGVRAEVTYNRGLKRPEYRVTLDDIKNINSLKDLENYAVHY